MRCVVHWRYAVRALTYLWFNYGRQICAIISRVFSHLVLVGVCVCECALWTCGRRAARRGFWARGIVLIRAKFARQYLRDSFGGVQKFRKRITHTQGPHRGEWKRELPAPDGVCFSRVYI